MIVKITGVLSKALELINRIADVITFILTGYAKAEEKKEEFEENLSKYARYILIGALSCGAALIIIFIIKRIVKSSKKRKAKKIQKAIERQQALEI